MNSYRASRVALVSALTALVVTACSERSEAPTEPINDGDVTEVIIRDFRFSVPTITIDRGTSVRWRNSTSTFHTVTPDGHQAFAEQQSSTPGQTFEVRFDEPGRYRYYCDPHRTLGMTGEIIVR